MDDVEQAVDLSVGRGCGFVALGILCVMLGTAFEPATAFKAGGILAFALAVTLIVRARFAHRRQYRHTEAWIILDKKSRPAEAIAQQVMTAALREAYLRYARFAVLHAILFLGISATLALFGFA